MRGKMYVWKSFALSRCCSQNNKTKSVRPSPLSFRALHLHNTENIDIKFRKKGKSWRIRNSTKSYYLWCQSVWKIAYWRANKQRKWLRMRSFVIFWIFFFCNEKHPKSLWWAQLNLESTHVSLIEWDSRTSHNRLTCMFSRASDPIWDMCLCDDCRSDDLLISQANNEIESLFWHSIRFRYVSIIFFFSLVFFSSMFWIHYRRQSKRICCFSDFSSTHRRRQQQPPHNDGRWMY